MSLRIDRIEIDTDRRVLCTSDVHGNCSGLIELLERVEYSDDDQLIILGDIVHKAIDNGLETLRLVMKLQEDNPDVHVVCGNCDYTTIELLEMEEYTEYVMSYINMKGCILNEMAKEIGLDYKDMSVSDIREILSKEFAEEIEWIRDLPQIIDTPYMTFVHAGITSEKLEDNDFEGVMSMRFFNDKAPCFSKYVMVGHYPTANYCDFIASCNPFVNEDKKIIHIDGGNGVKSDGQLNMLEFDDISTLEFKNHFVRLGKEMVATKDQEASTTGKSITWNDCEVSIVETNGDEIIVEHVSSGYNMKVGINDTYEYQGKLCLIDTTDYRLPIKKGDVLRMYRETSSSYYVSKDGIVGWYDK